MSLPFRYLNPVVDLFNKRKKKSIFDELPPLPFSERAMGGYVGRATMPSPNSSLSENPSDVINKTVSPMLLAEIERLRGSATTLAEEQASQLENLDPLPSELRPMRENLNREATAIAALPVTATYDPREERFKGKARHLGEAFLLGLEGARDPRTGYVDPLMAGVAATAGSLFGGKGIHNEIARRFIQPRLDESNARRREAFASNAATLATVAKTNPNNAENRVRATAARLGTLNTERERLEGERRMQIDVGLRDREHLRGIEKEDRAYQRALDVAALNKIIGRGNSSSTNGKAALTFSQKFSGEVDDASNEVAAAMSAADISYGKANALEATLGDIADPSAEGKARQDIAVARAEAKAQMQRAREAAHRHAQRINSTYGTKVIDVQENFDGSGNLTYVKLVPTANSGEVVREFFNKEAGAGVTVDDDDVLELVEEFNRRRKQRR